MEIVDRKECDHVEHADRAAGDAGLAPSAIRYYEKAGLLSGPFAWAISGATAQRLLAAFDSPAARDAGFTIAETGPSHRLLGGNTAFGWLLAGLRKSTSRCCASRV
jgi:hypothetical protein